MPIRGLEFYTAKYTKQAEPSVLRNHRIGIEASHFLRKLTSQRDPTLNATGALPLPYLIEKELENYKCV
jgi:hypothetical protein